ncbi:MAG: hypothetical protein M0010_21930 [Actinomycetota bacterium]|nr:hypothetical protein [Actinomycetota bacterium]
MNLSEDQLTSEQLRAVQAKMILDQLNLLSLSLDDLVVGGHPKLAPFGQRSSR